VEISLLDPVDIAIAEDIGTGDLTSLFFIPEKRVSRGRIFAKEACVVAGVGVVQRIYQKLDPGLDLRILRPDGSVVKPGESVIELAGSTRAILTGERIALNFLQRLSGERNAYSFKEFFDGGERRTLQVLANHHDKCFRA